MANAESLAVLRDIHALFHVGTTNGLTDGQLLDRFRARADASSSEAAFAALMARHGPMVLGVCRRALRNPHDVADAFQATFLILVRKADTVRVDDSLGRWLYGVSRRVSVRAKRAAARQSAREVGGFALAADPSAGADTDVGELRGILDEEIGHLPEKFRSAVVLCELEGLGHDEAARQLGCAPGTVKSRLSRAREKLRSRLIRRGVAPAAWALYAESTSAAVPARLMETTVKAALRSADGVISPAVTLLNQGVLRAMFVKKLSLITITVAAGLLMATSAGVWATQATAHGPLNQAGGQLVEKQAAVENEPKTTADSTVVELEWKTKEDESFDRVETLRVDIELLELEVQSLKHGLQATHNQILNLDVPGANDPKRSEQIESLLKYLKDYRQKYLTKKKELIRKQRELAEATRKQADEFHARQRAVIQMRAAATTKPVPTEPVAPAAPSISPILEERLSGIEAKLDSVLKALRDLRREVRH
jgi:RNA polymerase sigma-70 factor (ECF subfamily)